MFLTSLLWQLQEFDKERFPYSEIVDVSGFDEVSSGVRREDTFPFLSYRSQMINEKKWPVKTTDIRRFSCQFRCSGKWLKFHKWKIFRPSWLQQLDILDFPGERIADAAIAACGNFDQWSDHIFRCFAGSPGYHDSGERLREILETENEAGNLKVDIVVREYRKILVKSTLDDYKPMISPSVFLLDWNEKLDEMYREGKTLKYEQIENAASECPCGLNADSQFAPLPESVREANPELTKKMREHFDRYHQEIVKPLFDDLAKSDSLIVLVDIPSLLLGGVQRHNDHRQIISDLFSVIVKEKSKIFSSLKRIAFVATKLDLILPNDRKNEYLKSLLKKMTTRVSGDMKARMSENMRTRVSEWLSNTKIGWFECSACWSTTERGGSKDTLSGVPRKDNSEKKPMEFRVSELPHEWPESWTPGDYTFPDVYPDISSNIQRPPKHQGLDRIFDFTVIR